MFLDGGGAGEEVHASELANERRDGLFLPGEGQLGSVESHRPVAVLVKTSSGKKH